MSVTALSAIEISHSQRVDARLKGLQSVPLSAPVPASRRDQEVEGGRVGCWRAAGQVAVMKPAM